jgi:autotransporter-associated beta strand protein
MEVKPPIPPRQFRHFFWIFGAEKITLFPMSKLPGKTSPSLLSFFVFAAITLAWSDHGHGATLTWDGNTGEEGLQDGGGNWDLASTGRWFNSTTNDYQLWNNATPDSAIIGVNSAAAGVQTINLTNPITVHDLTFNLSGTTAYTIVPTTTNKLTLGGPDTPVIDITRATEATGIVTINGVLAGNSGFTKTGSGQLTLGGGSANELTGLTTVSDGILLMDKTSGNAINGDIIITGPGVSTGVSDPPGVLRWNRSNQVADSASITLDGGTLWIGGQTETIANLTLNSGNSNGGTGSNGGTFNITNTLTINNTHNLVLNSGTNWSANRLVITGTSGTALSITGNNTERISRLTIGSGGLSLEGTRTITLNVGTAEDARGSRIDLNGNVTSTGIITINRSGAANGMARINMGAATRIWDIQLETTNVGVTIEGDADTGLTKTGAGVLQFSGDATTANTYTGLTTLSGGTLKLAKSAGVTSIAGNITITSGILDWDNNDQIADTATINLNGGVLKFDNATETFANLNQTAGTINHNNDSNGGIVTITGTLTVSGGGSINLNSAGRWSANTVVFTNTFTGNAISLNGNTNTVMNRFTVGAGGITLNSGQNILLSRAALENGKGSELVLNGSFTTSGTNNINVGGGAVGAAQINLNGGQRIFNITSGTTTSNAAIVSSTITLSGDDATPTTGGITKTGAGVLTLNAANTYTGNTIISQGTLRLGAAGSITPSPRITVATSAIYDVSAVTAYTLAAGRTIEGGGQIQGNTTIASGATLSIGTVGGDVTQTLSFAAGLTLSSGSSTYLDLGTPADSDQLSVAGILTQSDGARIIVDPNGFVASAGQSYQLLTFGTGSTFSSNLGPLLRTGNEDNDTDFDLPDISASGLMWDVSQFTSSGVVTIIPEPSRVILIVGATAAMLLPRRRSLR